MRRKKNRSGRAFITILCAAALLLAAAAGTVLLTHDGWSALTLAAAEAGSGTSIKNLPAGSKVYSAHVLLTDLQSGQAVYSSGAEEKVYPASLTKIATVLCALEKCGDLSESVTLQNADFQGLKAQNAAVAGFKVNEKVTVKDLLYGTMLPSGAEAAKGLANHLFGSEKKMAEEMNNLAGRLGMTGSHFANVTGLHDRNHYTTAADMSRLLQYALQNPDFRTIFTARRYTVSPTNLHTQGFTLRSLLFQGLSDPAFPGGEILGGKTGYTSEAGLCLASLARKDGREYILVTLGAPGDHGTEQYNIADALTLYTACPA